MCPEIRKTANVKAIKKFLMSPPMIVLTVVSRAGSVDPFRVTPQIWC